MDALVGQLRAYRGEADAMRLMQQAASRIEGLQRAVDAVGGEVSRAIEAEREECAKIADEQAAGTRGHQTVAANMAEVIAGDIRARGGRAAK